VVSEAVDVNELNIWGEPKPQKIKATPGLRHIVTGIFGAVVLPIIPAIVVGTSLVMKNVSDLTDSAKINQELTHALSTGSLVIIMLVLTWIGLLSPVLWAGRKIVGGWRAMIGWKFAWKKDILIALAFAVSMRLVEHIVTVILGSNGIDTHKFSNGGLLDAGGSKWIVVLALAASIGAPIAEEVFFRGLVLKVTMRRFGKYVGVAVSSVLFGLMHMQGSLSASIYMGLSTAIIGVGLALLVLRTGRLGTSILSHGAFNASAVLLAVIGWS
jgi:hypothetical protein